MDVSNKWTVSVDCRGIGPDETTLLEPGTVRTAVVKPGAGEIPIGEIRMMLLGCEVRIVGADTGRDGVVELTPDMVTAARRSLDYQRSLLDWFARAGEA